MNVKMSKTRKEGIKRAAKRVVEAMEIVMRSMKHREHTADELIGLWAMISVQQKIMASMSKQLTKYIREG